MVDDSELTFVFGTIDGTDKYLVASDLLEQLQADGPGIAKYHFIANKLDAATRDQAKGKLNNAIKSILLAANEISEDEHATAKQLRYVLDSWLYQLQRRL
jgi:hypothetical protein